MCRTKLIAKFCAIVRGSLRLARKMSASRKPANAPRSGKSDGFAGMQVVEILLTRPNKYRYAGSLYATFRNRMHDTLAAEEFDARVQTFG